MLTRYVLRLAWLAFAVWLASEVVAFAYWLLQSRKHGDGIRFVENEPSRDVDQAVLAAP